MNKKYWNPADDYADEHPIVLPPSPARKLYKKVDGRLKMTKDEVLCYCLGTGEERKSNGYGKEDTVIKCRTCKGTGYMPRKQAEREK